MTTPSYKSVAKNVAAGHKNTVAKRMTQLASAATVNADVQAAVVTNSDREAKPTSAVSNPAKSHENEKWDLASRIRNNVKRGLNAAADTLALGVAPGLIRQALTDPLSVVDVGTTIPAMVADLKALTLKVGMQKQNGWKMFRVSDGWAVLAKFINHTASVVRTRAVAILEETEVKSTTASTHVLSGDLVALNVKNEIHRVADAFGLDAKTLTMLLQLSAKIHANGALDLASTTTAKLSGLVGVDIASLGYIHQAASLHSMTEPAGASITMSGGIVAINGIVLINGVPFMNGFIPTPPLLLPTPPLPTLVLPIVPPVPLTPAATTRTCPQYEGMNGHEADVLEDY